MSFFSPVVKPFTLFCDPPHPNLLWDLPESALGNECLPDHQNNAMFFTEFQVYRSGGVEAMDIDPWPHLISHEGGENFETSVDMEPLLPSSSDIQRKLREVDQWLEEQSRNAIGHISSSCSNSLYNRESTGDSGAIPHHLLVQLGLASCNFATSFGRPTIYHNFGRHSNERDVVVDYNLNKTRNSEAPGVVSLSKFNSPEIKEEEIDCAPKDYGVDSREIFSENPISTSQSAESRSSLSQLFQDEDLNEEDVREIARSVNTINCSVSHKGPFLEATPYDRKTALGLPHSVHCKSQMLASSAGRKTISDPTANGSDHHTAENPVHVEPSVEKLPIPLKLNATKIVEVEGNSKDQLNHNVGPSQIASSNPSDKTPENRCRESGYAPAVEGITPTLGLANELVEMQQTFPQKLELASKLPGMPQTSPSLVELPTELAEVTQRSPQKSEHSPKLQEVPQKFPPKVDLSTEIAEMPQTPPRKSDVAFERTEVPQTHQQCSLVSESMEWSLSSLSLVPSPDAMKTPNAADCQLRLSPTKTAETKHISPKKCSTSPKTEKSAIGSPGKPKTPTEVVGTPPTLAGDAHPGEEIIKPHVTYESVNDEPTFECEKSMSQSSLSQLFQTQEFTVNQYVDMVRCSIQPSMTEDESADCSEMKTRDIEETEYSTLDCSTDIAQQGERTTKISSQPFTTRGNERKLFDISIKREEDQPWKKQVTEVVLEPLEEVSKRYQKPSEEIPMVVSPYFPNEGNHPVQEDKRTSLYDAPEEISSQVCQLPEDGSRQDVLKKIPNYELLTDEYQLCKEFFSQQPQRATKPSLKGKRLETDQRSDDGNPRAKKPRIPKKCQSDQKITDYFSVVKKFSKNNSPISREPLSKISKDSSQDDSNYERALVRFKFDDLPRGTPMKMSNFHAPRSQLDEVLNQELRHLGTPRDPAQPKRDNLDAPYDPVANINLGESGQTRASSEELHAEDESHELIEFNCFQRERPDQNEESCDLVYLKEDQVEEIASSMEQSGDLIEIGFTICYKHRYSRLNMPEENTGSVHNPCGIMSRVEFTGYKTLAIYQDVSGLQGENGRSFILCLLESKCRKVCFEAQAFIMFILDTLKEPDLRICYDWLLLDPMIGMWLVDPDHPPRSFLQILKILGLQEVELSCEDWKKTVSTYLYVQSLVIEKLYEKLTNLNLWDVFYHMETPITPILAAMELRNIGVDYSRLKETSKVLQEKIAKIENDAWIVVGKKFQISSPVQLRKILYEELKLDELGAMKVKTTAASKAKSTDEGTLKSLAGLHPLPNLVLEYRRAHKIKSTYIDGIMAHVADKSHISTTWEQCAAATGRITSSNPNMQSIPKGKEDITIAGENFNARKVFVCRPGCNFIAVDFQQIELRTFAHLSKDEHLISVFKQPGDIFNAMTQMRLGTDEFDSAEREKTKTLMYALLYGAGAQKISELLLIDAASANRICGDFYRLFPGLKYFRSTMLEECRARKELRSLSGRRRLFPHITASCIKQKRYTERQAVNFIIQGTAADICKAAMLRTELALRKTGFNASLLLQIHDELLWEVPKELTSHVKGVIQKCIEETSDYWGKKFKVNIPLPVKITSGSSWGSMN